MSAIPVQPTQLPSGFCPEGYQSLLNAFSAHQFVDVTGVAGGLTVSATKPSDQSLPWLQLDQFGRPVRIYKFAQGAWLSLHPDVSGKTILWTTTLPDFTTFDGGDALAASAISGPMWEEVTELRARFPLGAGTLPSATAVAIGDTGGEELHVLVIDELPEHAHTVSARTASDINAGGRTIAGNGTEFPDSFNTGTVGADQGHATMPPWLGVAFLRRTSRMYYRVDA